MRIGFDASQTGACKAGCGYFAHSLIRHLEVEDKENQYILYPTFGDTFWDPSWSSGTFQPTRANFQRGPSHRSLEDAKAFWRDPCADLEAFLGKPDIIHANNFFCPVGLKKPRVVYTLYDLAFVDYPDWTTEENRIACLNGLFNASLYADRIVSISEYSRQHFLEVFPHYPAERVSVVYPASRFTRGTNRKRRPSNLPSPLTANRFWLHVGTVEPRKNQKKLLSAYAEYKARGTTLLPLVLAGGRGWLMDDFEESVRANGLVDDLIILGYVDDSVLGWLYENCLALIFPSLFEGFGLPVVEAMSLGTPVIASNKTSLPEIVGDAGILVDPLDTNQIVDAMVKLASNTECRGELGSRAKERAKNFSWVRAAREVLEIYRHLYETSR